MSKISINELSQTISELIDLDLDQQSLLESAVDRAISAKDIVGGRRRYHPLPGYHPTPIINGKIGYPRPTHPRPERPLLINGTMVTNLPVT